jgi:bacterial/archaeal transporter family protein
MQIGGASNIAPVDKLSLIIVAIFAFTFLREQHLLREWCGISMIAAGVLLLVIKR